MGNKSSDHSDEHCVRFNFKAEFLLEFFLAFCLSGKIEFGESCGDFAIGGRIIAFGIDSVEDSRKFIFSFPEKAIHSPRKPGILDLFRISRAYGGNCIALINAGFHIVAASVIFDKTASVFRNSENICRKVHIIVSLILDVMDAENCFDSGIFFFAHVEKS